MAVQSNETKKEIIWFMLSSENKFTIDIYNYLPKKIRNSTKITNKVHIMSISVLYIHFSNKNFKFSISLIED